MSEILNREFALACSRAHAFKVFTQMVDLWWPRGHRRTPDATMVLQPMHGGRLVERAPDGSEWIIGEIITFEPPSLLEFNWYPGAPNAPTHVAVAFKEHQSGALIAISHQAITPEAKSLWPEKITLFQRGWDAILPAYQRHCATTA